MKLRPIFAVLPLFLAVPLDARAQGARPELPLKASLASEEPTGVFFDRDTVVPQTPMLFSARIENPAPEARQVNLEWKISDSSGKVIWARASKFSVAGGDSIVRRELFDAPARGGYLLEIVASSKLKGPDTVAKANLPFAVAVAPSPNAGGARPQSFFVLSTPAMLSGNQLDFYSRLGARVLRSPLPPDPARPDWASVEAQLGERLKRNLATIALLPLGDAGSRRSETFWARQVPATLARYGSLSTWELAGDLSPSDLDAWSQLARARRRDVSLLGPLPSDLPLGLPANASIRVGGLEGATFDWPDFAAHPAALRRLWLSRAAATRNAGLPAFHLRRDAESEAALSPQNAAGEMTADYLSAIMAGAASMSEKLSPPLGGQSAARVMARGAAFSMLSRTLEDAAFREELFPLSPAFEGALFRAPRGSIAMLYATRDSGKMLARIAPARAYDVFGNPLAADRNGAIEIPLGGQPIFVVAPVPTDVLSFALRNAKIAGIRPLEAQFLPLSRLPGSGTGSQAIRVRLQNIGLGQQSGQIALNVPKTWKLATPRFAFQLKEGESKTYEFRATVAPANPQWPRGRVPLGISIGGTAKLGFEAQVPVVSALEVASGELLRLDGDLADWNDAVWQNAGPNSGGVAAQVALKWDEKSLYIAAQVRENGLSARRPDENAYEFWRGYDALQIAFGTSEGPQTVPARAPFRDADRGFLLSPFNQKGPSEYEGRVLKLWGSDRPYNSVADRTRWAGAVQGANCVVARDEKNGVTTYEARLPWSALPNISPQRLAARDGAIRFGWILHNGEGAPLDWARSAGTFSWWSNTATFLPEGQLTSPLRFTLGFTPNAATPAATSPVTLPPVAPVPVAPIPPAPAPFPAPLPDLPPPSGPLQPQIIAPAPPTEIAPFIVPSSDNPQLLPPAPPR